MSGGHFYPEYCYNQISSFADDVENDIENNGKEREDTGYYGEKYYPKYSDEVIDYIKSQIPQMRKISEIMRHIDYLYAGDHGEDSFMERVKEVEAKYD